MIKNRVKKFGLLSAVLVIAPLLQSCASTNHDKNEPYPTEGSSIPIGAAIVGAILLSDNGEIRVVGRDGKEASRCEIITLEELEKISDGENINEKWLKELNRKRLATSKLPVCNTLIGTSVIDGSAGLSLIRTSKSPPCWHIQYSFGQPVWWLPPDCM